MTYVGQQDLAAVKELNNGDIYLAGRVGYSASLPLALQPGVYYAPSVVADNQGFSDIDCIVLGFTGAQQIGLGTYYGGVAGGNHEQIYALCSRQQAPVHGRLYQQAYGSQ
ncbi:MAG: hypothetical protein IPP33_09390 [Flavobacteriales bacterium]|nr:hypothetical protein [Flavobacteriales bacterium]